MAFWDTHDFLFMIFFIDKAIPYINCATSFHFSAVRNGLNILVQSPALGRIPVLDMSNTLFVGTSSSSPAASIPKLTQVGEPRFSQCCML